MSDDWPISVGREEYHPIPASWIEFGHDAGDGDGTRIYAVSVAAVPGTRGLLAIRYLHPRSEQTLRVTTKGAPNPTGDGLIPASLRQYHDWPRSRLAYADPTGSAREPEIEHLQELWHERVAEIPAPEEAVEDQRELMTDGGRDEIAVDVCQRRIAGGQTCPDCDEVVSVVDRFCRFCGAQLRELVAEPEGVYLAGPMNHVDDHGRGWREHLIKHVDDVAFHNPLNINEDYEFDAGEPVPTWVVDADLEMVAQAETVLAWLPFRTPSRGTAVEIWEAGKDPETDVVVWTETAHPDRYSPFVRDPADEFVFTIDDAVDAIGGTFQEVSDDAE